jgi:trans-aconitate 2-methyltransferase
MTEWNAPEYARIAALQEVMAAKALSLLDLKGSERVLDLGCGNGKVTAQIATRVPEGSVVGVDASAHMIDFASQQYPRSARPNLHFETCDIRHLSFHQEFDLVVSFNALHWIPQQEEALGAIHAAMKPGARARLRLVPAGQRKSLENVLEETRLSSRWAGYYHDFRDPYLHLTPDDYAALAEHSGLQVESIDTTDEAWDFRSRAGFEAFGSVTFVEWTKLLPEDDRPDFVKDVLDRYRSEVANSPGEENTFKFYQMNVSLLRGDGVGTSKTSTA